jgi:hypothetical protein
LHAFKAGEPAGHVFPGAAKAVGQDCRVDRRFGRAGTDMRPNHKGSIAGQRHPAERQCRRFEIEDRLKKGFRSQKDLSQLRREQRLGVGFDPRDRLMANE